MFYSLRLTPFIGPIFMLAYKIIFDLIGYFCLLISAVGTLLFRDLDNFRYIEDSLVTLFEACWGQFTFSDTNNGRFGDVTGYLFMHRSIFNLISI